MADDVVPKSSNIINDTEMCQRFYEEALRVTNSLKYRYFSVFECMTAEDIVMECFVKVLKGGISYDDSRGCKFETFVRMIVTCQLTDELKRLSASKRAGVCVSLDLEVQRLEHTDEVNTLYNTIGDTRSKYYYDYSEVRSDIDGIEKELGVKEPIIRMCEEGYSISDISIASEIEKRDIRKRLQEIKNIYINRCRGTSMLISEILYGDEDILEERKKDLLSVAGLIRDDKTGISLQDVIKLVLKGYSYKGISKKLGMEESDVRRFLTKYESLTI